MVNILIRAIELAVTTPVRPLAAYRVAQDVGA